ncbi:MAG: hypothetical protein GY898_23140 [Proteobacteria bacterium]|nr:hypothetical protein [Pseudomonadota bacterium]
MARVTTMTRNTRTSTEALAKRTADLVVENLPDVIRRVVDTNNASALKLTLKVNPPGRTEATKDPEISIRCKPDFGDEIVTLKARLTGEGDDAQLSLISELSPEEVGFQDDQTGESGEEAATG